MRHSKIHCIRGNGVGRNGPIAKEVRFFDFLGGSRRVVAGLPVSFGECYFNAARGPVLLLALKEQLFRYSINVRANFVCYVRIENAHSLIKEYTMQRNSQMYVYGCVRGLCGWMRSLLLFRALIGNSHLPEIIPFSAQPLRITFPNYTREIRWFHTPANIAFQSITSKQVFSYSQRQEASFFLSSSVSSSASSRPGNARVHREGERDSGMLFLFLGGNWFHAACADTRARATRVCHVRESREYGEWKREKEMQVCE